MNRILRLAAAYWALVFTLGFALGAIRTLWLAPQIGAEVAVLAEQVPMLTASWLVARALLRRWPLPSQGAALAMGAAAFALLMIAECALAVLLFGQTPAIWAASLTTPAGALGLAGQLGFSLVPGLVWNAKRGHADQR